MASEGPALFDDRVDLYARYRPTYPAGVRDTLLANLPPPVHALDVGCGTGISTRWLAAAVHRVVGIDPSGAMLDRALADSRGLPNVTYRRASAERTGAADGSIDLVLCAQSYHWFEEQAALDELARILRPGGRLAAMWNRRDERDPVSAAYAKVADRARRDAAARGRPVPARRGLPALAHPGFGPLHHVRVEHEDRLRRDELIGRARSASYFPAGGPLREELEKTLREMYDAHERGGRVAIRYHTEVAIAERV